MILKTPYGDVGIAIRVDPRTLDSVVSVSVPIANGDVKIVEINQFTGRHMVVEYGNRTLKVEDPPSPVIGLAAEED